MKRAGEATAAVRIRTMRAGDVPAAIRLWNRTPGMSTVDTVPLIRGFLKRNPGGSFVAVRGARLVGAVLGGHDGRRGVLWHLAVLPAYRRAGLGKTLVDRAVGVLRRRGLPKINILVLTTNRTGMAFWRRLGWEPVPANVLTYRLAERR